MTIIGLAHPAIIIRMVPPFYLEMMEIVRQVVQLVAEAAEQGTEHLGVEDFMATVPRGLMAAGVTPF